ncbi:MAG: DNA translocase FtsK [Ignavibacteriaceae bacterium]|nr:DNA translocase FtsK [Ignavibacteriaceae bacterium]
MAKKKPAEKKTNSQSFTLTWEKKKKIFGFGLFIFAIMMLLSVISFSTNDVQLFHRKGIGEILTSLFTFPRTDNWLNVFGALMSFVLVDGLLGYFSIVIPVALVIWSFFLFDKITLKKTINYSNFLFLSAILVASFFGVLKLKQVIEVNYLCGNLGALIGGTLARFIGTIGAILIITLILVIMMIISFDLKIEKLFHWMKVGAEKTVSKTGEGISNVVTKYKEDARKEKEAVKARDESSAKTIEHIKAYKKAEDTPNAQRNEENDSKGVYKPAPIKRSAAEHSQEKEKEKEETGGGLFSIFRKEERTEDEQAVSAEKHDFSNVKIVKTEDDEISVNEYPEHEDSRAESEVTDEEGFEVDRHKEAKAPEQWEESIQFRDHYYELLGLLKHHDPRDEQKVSDEELHGNAQLLIEKLATFDIGAEVIKIVSGPTVTLYELKPAAEVKISKIVSLENDIALALAARGIRIIAPIPGKSAIGVEIPNSKMIPVFARSVLQKIKEVSDPVNKKDKMELPLAIGKNIAGEIYYDDLAKVPHLLIAGATGSGKSVGVNMIISSLLFSKRPDEVKFAIIDPKKIELSFYRALKYHYLAVCPDLDEDIVTSPQNAIILLKSVVLEMEKRYDMLAKAACRNILEYNDKIKDDKRRPRDTETIKHFYLPYIVVIIDELADLMITAGKEVEEPIARLAQLARAVGIHLVVATQRPSVNVITGTIKANFSARMAYQVASGIDSRTILDGKGAEQLLGRGDMLYLPSGSPKPVRVQNAFISTEEVEKVTEFLSKTEGYSKPYSLPSLYDRTLGGGGKLIEDMDPLFEDAARVIVQSNKGSVSLLQRKLKLGYARAARIVDQLEQAGIVGPNNGSKEREVLVNGLDELETIIRNL